MANTFKFGNKNWAWKEDYVLAYNDENNNFKPLPFDFTRSSSATRVNSSGLVETVVSGEPRVDYLNNADGHLLLEPSRTNLVTYSEDFSDSSWAKQSGGTGTAPVVTSNDAISPDGTQNADKVVFDKGSGSSTSDLSILSASFTSQANTASFYVKADSAQRIVVRNSGTWVGYDITTEWTRIEKTDSGGSLQIGLRDGYGVSDVPDTATIYLWGAQIEAGSYATSYIPTSGSSVTRAIDSCYQDNLPTSVIDSSYPFTVYAEGIANTENVYHLLSFGDRGAPNEYFTIGIGTDGVVYLDARANGISENLYSTSSPVSDGDLFKVAFTMESATSGKLCVNGVLDTKTNYTQQTINTSINDLLVGMLRTVTDTGRRMPVLDIKLYNTALTDAELQALTT